MEVVVLSVTEEDQTADNVDESCGGQVSSVFNGAANFWESVRIADGFLPK